MVSKDAANLTQAMLGELDKRKDGTVDLNDLKELMRRLQKDFSEQAFDQICAGLPNGCEGRVRLDAFCEHIFQRGRGDVVCSCPKHREWAEPVQLDRSILNDFLALDQGGRLTVEYVWIDEEYSDGKSFDLCSKAMSLDQTQHAAPLTASDLPTWSYAGSDNTDVQMVPRRVYRDPFRRGQNIIVLVDCYEQPEAGSGQAHGPPRSYNTRAACDAAMARALSAGDDPWFGIEQEYYLLDLKTSWPLGWPAGKFPGHHEAYFCATGANKCIGRDIVECHYRACLFAGVKISGINSEVAPGQWEFQVGPCSGTSAGDDLWMARYLLQRICEMFHVGITFDPKPVPGWAGIGCHTNYSTKATRDEKGGMDAMVAQIERLRKKHDDHIAVYGDGNERRLTGKDDTMDIRKFEHSNDRTTSIRIPIKVAAKGYGYYEDRRPAANMDPYQVTQILVETTLLQDSSAKDAAPKP
mmetsp:Transcript_117879/g.328355  ORF Transcript_117879/g.328355 Transcript_117879/m.328355 type:complete len:467 (-) Transcript_117879:262-1662(-)